MSTMIAYKQYCAFSIWMISTKTMMSFVDKPRFSNAQNAASPRPFTCNSSVLKSPLIVNAICYTNYY